MTEESKLILKGFIDAIDASLLRGIIRETPDGLVFEGFNVPNKNGKVTIYKNGDYTTVKWADGTTTTVKRQPDDEDDTVRAFEEALAKKMFESRSALKRFVEKRTVDVAEQKRRKEAKRNAKKKSEKESSKPSETTTYTKRVVDSKDQEITVGCKIYISDVKGYAEYFYDNKRIQDALLGIEGKIVECTGISRDGNVMVTVDDENGDEVDIYIPTHYLTKVKTEMPFEEGDWVVVKKPEGDFIWGCGMDGSEDVPIEFKKWVTNDAFDAYYSDKLWCYRTDWVRKE